MTFYGDGVALSTEEEASRPAFVSGLQSGVFLKLAGIGYKLNHLCARSEGAEVWQTTDDFGSMRAVKMEVAGADELREEAIRERVSRARRLESSPYFPTMSNACALAVPSGNTVLASIVQWVEGTPLSGWLAQQQAFGPHTMVGLVSQLCDILEVLFDSRLEHLDLHMANVLVAPTLLPSEPEQGHVLRIVDLSTLAERNTSDWTQRHDTHGVINIVLTLHNHLTRTRPNERVSVRFLNGSEEMLNLMVDDDPGRALASPQAIRDGYRQVLNRSQTPSVRSLGSPFEYLSAEQIGDDTQLAEVFSQHVPWLERLYGHTPTLLTGPRGCGKTTLLRWLSKPCQLTLHGGPDPDELGFTGVFISCRSVLHNRLSHIRDSEHAQRLRSHIVAYFTLIVARETLNTLHAMELEEASAVPHDPALRVTQWLMARLAPNEPLVRKASALGQAAEMLTYLASEVYMALRQEHDLQEALSDLPAVPDESFLEEFFEIVTRVMPYFRRRRFALLIDDYSTPLVSRPVQAILNRIIWSRNAAYTVKVSSEIHGATFADDLGGQIDITREMRVIDCGRDYMYTPNHGRSRQFAEDLLNKHLQAAGFSADAETLLGRSKFEEGSLGEALIGPNAKAKTHYHGIDVIAHLCSGDIATLLSIYSQIFEMGKVCRGSTERISKRVQHEAIEDVSRRMYARLQHHHPYGSKIHLVVREFAGLVAQILRDAEPHSDTGKPRQVPRIELDGDYDFYEEIPADVSGLMEELLRRGVFIEMTESRGLRTLSTISRLALRRIYLPAFKGSPYKNEAIRSDIHWLVGLLRDPKTACRKELLRWGKRDLTPRLPFEDPL